MLELLYVILSTVTGINRSVDANLAAIAQDRSAAIVCASPDFFTHAGKPQGVAEILVCFPSGGDDAQHAADAWMASQAHHDVLVNPAYHSIGCGYTVTGDSILFACELARGGLANTAQAPVAGLADRARGAAGYCGERVAATRFLVHRDSSTGFPFNCTAQSA